MKNVKAVPEGFHSLAVYLTVNDADKAIDFYKKALNAKEIGRLNSPDGKVGHAELQIGDSRFMLAEEMPEWGNKSPKTLGGSPAALCIYTENVDKLFKQALDAGAKIDKGMDIKDQFYGDRSGSIVDPFGHHWTIATHIEDMSYDEMQKRYDDMFSEQQKK